MGEGDPSNDSKEGEEDLLDNSSDCGQENPVNVREKESENFSADISEKEASKTAKPNKVDSVRRSVRHRVKPERLHYAQPENPLISIVQSLFQGLSLAFTDALHETKDPEPCLKPCSQVVSTQPLPCMIQGGR